MPVLALSAVTRPVRGKGTRLFMAGRGGDVLFSLRENKAAIGETLPTFDWPSTSQLRKGQPTDDRTAHIFATRKSLG
jgi:hypothetical protein